MKITEKTCFRVANQGANSEGFGKKVLPRRKMGAGSEEAYTGTAGGTAERSKCSRSGYIK